MRITNPIKGAFIAAALTLSPAAALAQDDANNMVTDTQYTGVQQEEDDEFPLGLLGLLGLAGLLGLRKRDAGAVHVDARRNP